jgi:hypothetical protein
MSKPLAFILEIYQSTYDKAIQIYSLFDDAGTDELLRLRDDLNKLSLGLLDAAALDWSQCGSLGRHLDFMEYYLKRDEREGCRSDIKDILFYDLPAALRSTILNATNDLDLDEKLRDAIIPLMDGGHFDSAIRKVFVLLTERLRRSFGNADEIDGEDLVNLVFGKGGKIPVSLDDSKKQAFRNLISGFYGVYRNRYAHNDREATASDCQAIVHMANQLLQEIEVIAKKSAKNT